MLSQAPYPASLLARLYVSSLKTSSGGVGKTLEPRGLTKALARSSHSRPILSVGSPIGTSTPTTSVSGQSAISSRKDDRSSAPAHSPSHSSTASHPDRAQSIPITRVTRLPRWRQIHPQVGEKLFAITVAIFGELREEEFHEVVLPRLAEDHPVHG